MINTQFAPFYSCLIMHVWIDCALSCYLSLHFYVLRKFHILDRIHVFCVDLMLLRCSELQGHKIENGQVGAGKISQTSKWAIMGEGSARSTTRIKGRWFCRKLHVGMGGCSSVPNSNMKQILQNPILISYPPSYNLALGSIILPQVYILLSPNSEI